MERGVPLGQRATRRTRLTAPVTAGDAGVFLLPDDMQTIPVAAPGQRAIPLDKKPEWKPMQEVPSKMTARDAIAHCLLMGQGMYPSPEDWADAVLKRLAHEGFAVLRKEVETDVR